MKKLTILLIALLTACANPGREEKEPAAYVDPFIGTGGHGHTFPGATTPFGLVQLSPDTGTEGWDWCSGYHSDDHSIIGFSHLHLSGTGGADLGDILLMPGSGVVQFDPGTKEDPDAGYRSRFSHDNEVAEAGYYRVHLDDPGVTAELTATARAGVHRYTYGADTGHLIIDLRHGIQDVTHSGYYELVDDYTVKGWRRSNGWAPDHTVFFHAVFSHPVVRVESLADGQCSNAPSKQGAEVVLALHFDMPDSLLTVNVGISTVDLEGAANNVLAEVGTQSFDELRTQAWERWNNELGKITVEGGNDDKIVFYTALYHTLIAPNLFSDADGRYRGSDGNIHYDSQDVFALFSTWDTFRAQHPLMTILQPERNQRFIQSLLNYFTQSGRLPVWDLHMNENDCMIGYHSVPIIGDALLKGQRDFDVRLALEAMVHSAMQPRYRGLDHYRQLGYLPMDKENNSVSKALEYAYDDWVIAQTAKALGQDSLYRVFIRRAQFYKNHFDPGDGFFKGRYSDGSLDPEFDPDEISILGQGPFTEGNAWHYRFFTPQDISGHIELMGGDQDYIDALEAMFTASGTQADHSPDVTGLIGQYAQGNEPSHHAAYLYNYAGAPWLTQRRVNQIKREMYLTGRDGLCGNEDCGQMSAWLVFSAMGFYPVTPASGVYALGTPTFPRLDLRLDNGRTFTILAPAVSEKKFYVKSVRWNGEKYTRSYVTHEMIESGGTLEFEMSAKPDKSRGVAPQDRPVSEISARDRVTSEGMLEEIVFTPFITEPRRVFRDTITIYPMSNNGSDTEIRFCVNPGKCDDFVPVPLEGIVLNRPANVHLMAVRPDGKTSGTQQYRFYKSLLGDARVMLEKQPSEPYVNGGAESLTDARTGGPSYLDPAWVGFLGDDLVAVIDPGDPVKWNHIGLRAVNEPGSWILPPRSAFVEFSADGENYAYRHRIAVPDSRELQAGVYFFGTDISGVPPVRYIRLTLENGTLPGWHIGKGNPSWMFVDEIVAF